MKIPLDSAALFIAKVLRDVGYEGAVGMEAFPLEDSYHPLNWLDCVELLDRAGESGIMVFAHVCKNHTGDSVESFFSEQVIHTCAQGSLLCVSQSKTLPKQLKSPTQPSPAP